jgi:hypothetical protein
LGGIPLAAAALVTFAKLWKKLPSADDAGPEEPRLPLPRSRAS